jgi:hypothetical protein
VGDSDVGVSSGFCALWILIALVVVLGTVWDKLERNSTYPVTRTRRGTTVPARSVIDYQKCRYQGTANLNRSIWPHLWARQNNKGSLGWLSVLFRQSVLVEMCVWLGSTPLVPCIMIGVPEGERALGERYQAVGSYSRFLSAEA